MFEWYNAWRDRRIIANNPIDERDWQSVLAQLPILARLKPDDLARLRKLAILFMHQKRFVGMHGLVLTGNMALLIALQACLPILNLGLGWYRGWQTILVYPTAFRTRHTQTDAAGVQHQLENTLAGEAWLRGGVVLSWDDAAVAGIIDGHNLVIHEFVHKLDMLTGNADGLIPLRRGMSRNFWSESFSRAYADFCERVERGEQLAIDRYGATNPAEFIAVASEVFFETPDVLHGIYPDVYHNLASLFGQNPLLEMGYMRPGL